MQIKTLKTSESNKPWITKAIKNSIARKNSLYKIHLKSRTDKSESKYKTYKNKLTSVLRKAEKEYYWEKLNNVRNNLSKTWKILNSLISRTQTKGTVDEVIVNNKIVRDPKIIADNFNSFFANIGPNLAAKIPKSSQSFTDHLHFSISESVVF